jgi:hypothetical protein
LRVVLPVRSIGTAPNSHGGGTRNDLQAYKERTDGADSLRQRIPALRVTGSAVAA